MCVILEGPANRLVSLVDDAMLSNPHGVGIAWVQKDKRIAYRKGITTARRAKKILRAIGTGDAVFHARIATSGGQHLLLTHPFRVERNSRVSYVGRDEDFLLFHNGISSLDWRSHVPAKSGLYWSDTRTLAHAIASGTARVQDLERDGGKWLLFYRDAGRAWIKRVGTWETHNLHPGVSFSNLHFMHARDWRRVQTGSWWEREYGLAAM